ncbi:Mitochondrial fission protein [Apophysomyces ossiformis]|uniref:Mitochondrial fission protein n=1 Tax=Apophysomyces ossiformis TaxID=679940 RepID=A0A8H7BSE0_9FUNG|nr:Mitochondrial fission protein [Apophysomyces ossiformis]
MRKEDAKQPMRNKKHDQGNNSTSTALRYPVTNLNFSSKDLVSVARDKAVGMAQSARDWLTPSFPDWRAPLSHLDSLTTVMFSPLAAHPVYRSESMAKALQLMQQQQMQRSATTTPSIGSELVLHGTQHVWPSSTALLKADIPESQAPLSLFQGFVAAYPSFSHAAPQKKQRKVSRSLTHIMSQREKRMRDLDRSSTANEISQINLQIEELMNKRNMLEVKWAKLEAKEQQLQMTIDGLNETIMDMETEAQGDIGRVEQRQREKRQAHIEEEYESGECFKSLHGHDESILCLDFNHAKGILASSSLDGTVRVWDLVSSRCIGTLEEHASLVRCLQLDDSRLLTGSDDGSIKQWNLSAITPAQSTSSVSSFSGFSSMPSSPTLSACTAAEDFLPTLSNCCVGVLDGHQESVTAIYADETTAVSGSNDKTMRQWDLETQQCVLTLDVVWASKSSGGSSSTWETLTSLDHWSLDNLHQTFFEPACDFIGSLQFWNFALASGTKDGKIRMWDLRTGQAHRTLSGHGGAVTCLQFDEVHLVSGSVDKTIRIWDLRTGSVFDTLTYSGPVTSLQFDAGKIASAVSSAGIDIYNRTSFQHTSLTGHTQPVNTIKFRRNVLASGGKDNVVKLWAL